MPNSDILFGLRLKRHSNNRHLHCSGGISEWRVSNGSVEQMKENTAFGYSKNWVKSHWHISWKALNPSGFPKSSLLMFLYPLYQIRQIPAEFGMCRLCRCHHKNRGQPPNDCPHYQGLKFLMIPLTVDLFSVFVTNLFHALPLLSLRFIYESDQLF